MDLLLIIIIIALAFIYSAISTVNRSIVKQTEEMKKLNEFLRNKHE